MTRLNQSRTEKARWQWQLLAAIPFPAMLVKGKQKKIAAANSSALKLGVKIGGYCWRSFDKYFGTPATSDTNNLPSSQAITPDNQSICNLCPDRTCPVANNLKMISNHNPSDRKWRSNCIQISATEFIFYSYEEGALSNESENDLPALSKLQHFIKGTNLGVWEWNVQTGETSFNQQWAQIVGYSLDELEPVSIATWRRLVHPDDLVQSDRLLQQHFNGDLDYYSIECRMKHKEGHWVWVHDQGVVVEWLENGKPLLMFGSHMDITYVKNVEQDIKNQAAFITSILDSIPDIVFYKDLNGVYLGCNTEFARHKGIPKEEILGKTDYDLYSKEEADQFRANDRLMLELGQPRHNEEWIKYPDGRTVLLDTLKTTIRDSRGNVIGILGICRDITEHTKHQDDLIQSLKTSEDIVNAIPSGMFIYRYEEPDKLYLISGNPEAVKLTGLNLDEYIGKEFNEIWPNAKEQGITNKYLQVVKTDETFQTEDLHYTDDKISGAFKIHVFTLPGNLLAVAFENITIRKQAENEIKFLSEITENISDSIIATDTNFVITYANKKAIEIYGYTLDELIGQTPSIFNTDNLSPDFQNRIYDCIIQGKMFEGEAYNKRKDGSEFYCEMKVKPLIDMFGKTYAYVGIQRDITERKKAELKLQLQGLVLDQINDHITITDLNGVITYVNRKEVETLQISEEALIGKKISIYGEDPQHGSSQGEILQQTLEQGTWRGEVANYAADGSEIIFDCRTQIIRDESGNPFALCGISTDITENKKAEAALRRSYEQYELLVQNSHDIIYKLAADGTFTYVSPAWTSLLGHSIEDIVNTSFRDYIHPEDLAACNLFLKSVVETEQRQSGIEYRVQHINGSWRYHTSKAVPFTDELGTVIGFVGNASDITERKLAEMAIRESEQKFFSAFATSPYALIITSQQTGEFIEVNNAFSIITGYSREEVMGKTTIDLNMWHKPEDRDFVVRTLASGKEVNDFELEFRIKNGNVITTQYSAKLVEFGDNLCILSSVNDITERKKAEADLLESQQKLSALFSAMTELVVLHKVIFNESGTPVNYQILDVNQSYLESFGLKRENVIGKLATEVYPSFEPPYLEEFTKVGITGVPYRFSTYYEGFNRWFDISVVSPTKNHFATITTDITTSKQLEQKLVESERLSAVGELASGVAHDFNNSLQAIVGNIELALLAQDNPNEIIECLKNIKNTAVDATARVKQLQRFAGKEKGTQHQSIDVNRLLEETVEQTRPKWKDASEKQGIKIAIDRQYKSTAAIDGNVGELRSAFFNLLTNAIEAMPEGGVIKLETEQSEACVLIRVSDTGVGMDDETAIRVFQPFFSTKGFELGRGLGLSSVYSIIRDHGGNIYIKETAVNKGTSIEISLPVGQEKKRSAVPEPPPVLKPEPRCLSVLWVDDEPSIRALGSKLLQKLGHQAEVAENGTSALKMLEQNRYDLLITDVGMPGMTGWQLAEAIKGRYSIKVAIVTGWGAEVSDEEKAKYGVDFILGKPVNLEELKKLLFCV